MAAARRAVGGAADDIAMLAAMGAGVEVIRKAAASAGEMPVWPENWKPLHLFLAMQTQWRMGMAGPVGLDYAALPAVEQRLGIGRRAARRIFPALQLMESEALRVFAEKRRTANG